MTPFLLALAAVAAPPLAAHRAQGMDYHFQPAPAGTVRPTLLVYLHGMQRGSPIGIEQQAGISHALSEWAATHGAALLIPHAPRGACGSSGFAGRDWYCWEPDRDWRRIDRLTKAIDKAEGGFAGRTAIGFSRGAYVLTVAWARGQLDGWTRAGALAGAQQQERFALSGRTPPLALQSGRHDPANGRHVDAFAEALDRRPGGPRHCLRKTEGAHLPKPDEVASFLDFVAACQPG